MRRRRGRFWAAGAALGMVAAMVPGPQATAAHVARIDVRPVQVPPGGEVTVAGPPGWAPSPVSIRWNAVDGEVLATFTTTTGGNASWGPGTVRIPANAAPGIYDLVGTQEAPAAQTALRGVPARARIQVVAPGSATGTPATVPGTPSINALQALEEEGGTAASAVALVGAVVFAVTLAIGLLIGMALRRRPAGSPDAGGSPSAAQS